MRCLILLVLMGVQLNLMARTWVVSNVPGFPADKNNLQECVDIASAGDIILVQGSGVTYGHIVVDKPLTIMGPGYFLGQNPETQTVPASAKISSIYFKYGATGSILQGMEVVSSQTGFPPCQGGWYNIEGSGSIRIDSCSVTILSNLVDGVDGISTGNWIGITNSTGTVISRNFIYGITADIKSAGLIVENNIINVGVDLTSAIVRNNIIDYNFNNGSGYYNSCTVSNNIITSATTIINTNFNNNISNGNPWGVNVGNNMTNVDMSTVFVGYPVKGSYSFDGRFKLRSGSPAIGMGDGGIDIGPFGGSTPYALSGISFHPNIWFVNMPTIGTSSGGLQVQIKVNANN